MPPIIDIEIRRLWDLLPHHRGTYIRWFARKGEDRIGGGVDTVEELILAAHSAEGMNFYVAPNPANTRAGTRHRADDVSHWSWFVIDIDPIETVARPEEVVESVLDLLGQWLNEDFQTRRPVIIYSGRGAQVWIRLGDIAFDGQQWIGLCRRIDRRVARLTNGYWLKGLAETIGTMHGCRIDTTCMDLPRVMRCPGTLNTKTGQTALLIVPSAEVFESLAEKMVMLTPAEVFTPVPVATLPKGTPWQQVLVHLTIRAQSYLTHGKDEPGRHDTMFHTALCLAERGLERDEVRRALQYGNERWDAAHPGAKMKLEPADIEHAMDTAFRRLQRAAQDDTLHVPHPLEPLSQEDQ